MSVAASVRKSLKFMIIMHFEYENYFLSFKTTLAVCYSFALLHSFRAHSHAFVLVIVMPTLALFLCAVRPAKFVCVRARLFLLAGCLLKFMRNSCCRANRKW